MFIGNVFLVLQITFDAKANFVSISFRCDDKLSLSSIITPRYSISQIVHGYFDGCLV